MVRLASVLEHWVCIDGARTQLESQYNQRKLAKQSIEDVERKVPSREKLVFESWIWTPKLEELYGNIRM